jgi:predicted NBD/HSP70 family sugar kinase
LSDTHFEVGLTNLAGELFTAPLQGSCAPGSDVVQQIAPLVDRAASDAKSAGLQVAGIGVAISGLVDHINGVVLDSTVFGINNLPLQAELERRYGLPVRIDGDVHARLLAEMRQSGPAFKDANVVYIYVGTGIGAVST